MRSRLSLLLVTAALLGILAAPGRGARGGLATPPSLFGLNTGTFDDSNARYALDTPHAAKLGARWVHFTGDSMRFTHGKPSFRIQDGLVDQALRYHLGVLLSLGSDPAACASPVTHCSPTNLTVYDAYLKHVLLHFRGRVQWFESWVEPNHASMWPPAPDPSAYAQLLENEYAVFQQVNARYGMDDKLLFAGIGGSDLGYLDQVLSALGGRKPFDAIAYHAYRFPPDDPSTPNYAISFPGGGHPKLTWMQELAGYENEFTAHGYGTPDMWLTEFGWPGANGPDGCGGDTSTEQDQASFLREPTRISSSFPSSRRPSTSTCATTCPALPTRTRPASPTTASRRPISSASRRASCSRARRPLPARRPAGELAGSAGARVSGHAGSTGRIIDLADIR